MLSTKLKNQILLTGGLQYFFIRRIGTGSSSGPFGSFTLDKTEMTRTKRNNPGWHVGFIYLIKNKKYREIIQFSAKYIGTFNTTQFTNDYIYSQFTPTNPPALLTNQVMRFRLTGASIQLGAGKTLRFFSKSAKNGYSQLKYHSLPPNQPLLPAFIFFQYRASLGGSTVNHAYLVHVAYLQGIHPKFVHHLAGHAVKAAAL